MMRKVLAVARFEFLSTVTRVGYLVTLIGMPLFIASVGGLSGLVTSRAVVDQLAQARVIGLIDESGLFSAAPARVEAELNMERLSTTLRGQRGLSLSAELRRYPDLAAARAALARDEVQSVVRIPRTYVQTGKLEEYRRGKLTPDFTGGEGTARLLRPWLVRGLLAGHADAALAERVIRPADWRVFVLEPDGSVGEQDLLREVRAFVVPMGFALLLLLSIFTSASYLATGLTEEKQNRALELMLTSLTPEQLFWGKLLGLGGAALLQFLLYLGAVALPAAFVFTALGLQLGQALIAFCYFVLGFLFYGAVLLAVGAIGNTQKYTQQLSGLFTFLAIMPFLMLPVLLQRPQGAVARVLTLVPFTAPLTGMLRAGAGALPWWEFLVSLVLLALGAAVVVRACSRIFRAALLSAGTLPSPAQLVEWLRG